MKRLILMISLASTILLLTGCNQARTPGLESEVSDLQRQVEDYESRISALQSSVEDSVSSFRSSAASLRGVAADIALAQAVLHSDHSSGVHMTQTAADNLDSAVSELESSINDLSSVL